MQLYKRLCPSVRPSISEHESKSGKTSILEAFCVCLCWKGGWVGHWVWMGVGCPCSPVLNDIVTPRHLLFKSFLEKAHIFSKFAHFWHHFLEIPQMRARGNVHSSAIIKSNSDCQSLSIPWANSTDVPIGRQRVTRGYKTVATPLPHPPFYRSTLRPSKHTDTHTVSQNLQFHTFSIRAWPTGQWTEGRTEKAYYSHVRD